MKFYMSKVLVVAWLIFVFVPMHCEAIVVQSDQTANAEEPQLTELQKVISGKKRLSGQVNCNSEPLSSAGLFLFNEQQLLATATTAADGSFSLELATGNVGQKLLDVINPRPVQLLVVAEGKVAKLRTLKNDPFATRFDDLQIELLEQESPLAGRIIDNQGIGVAGAELRVQSLLAGEKPVNIPAEVVSEFLRSQTTDDGTFQFDGLATSMLGSIFVTGDGLVPAALNATSFEAEVVLIAQPGRTVRGKVISNKDQSAVTNVMINVLGRGQKIAVDEQGTFELHGLPAFAPLRLFAEATTSGLGEQAYLPESKEVPIENGFEPIDVEFSMKPALWIDCSVVEFGASGLPNAQVFYFPTPENDDFQTYLARYQLQTQRPSVTTDAAGKARIVGLAGPGVIAISATGFPPNESVTSLTDEQRAMLQGVLAGRELTAVSWIELEDLQATPQINTWVSKGRSIDVELVGVGLESTDRLFVHRAQSKTTYLQLITGKQFSADQFQPGETRQILVHAPEKKLGGMLDVDAMAESPVKLEMKPTGSLIGKVVDKEGEPEAGLAIQFEIATDDGHEAIAPQVFTDANGRFQIRSLIASLKYRVAAVRPTNRQQVMMTDAPKQDSEWSVAKDLLIRGGQLVDLGQIVLGGDPPEPKWIEESTEDLADTGDAFLPTQLAGQILTMAGEPLAGASISLNTWPDRSGDLASDLELEPTVLAQSISDVSGNFQLNIEASLESKLLASQDDEQESNAALIVVTEKMGVLQLPITEITEPQDIKIQLSREMVVRGNVAVPSESDNIRLAPGAVLRVYDTATINQIVEKLKAGLDLQQASEPFQPISILDPLAGGLQSVWELNANGVFLVRNIPLNSIFDLHAVSEAGIEKTITVVSRPIRSFEYQSSGVSKLLSGSRIKLDLNRDSTEK